MTEPMQDWHDTGENGAYLNACVRCKEEFIGFRGRTLCPRCAAEVSKERSAPEEPTA